MHLSMAYLRHDMIDQVAAENDSVYTAASEARTLDGTQDFNTGAYECTLPPLFQHVDNDSQPPTLLARAINILMSIAPALTQTFIASLFIVLRPVANLSGKAEWSTLVLVFSTLSFHHHGRTVGKIFHSTTIGIIGTLLALGWSAIALQLGALCNHSGPSIGGRTIPGVFLAIAIFLSGAIKSRFPATATGCLMSSFMSVWLLSLSIVEDELPVVDILSLLYPSIFAPAIAMACALLVLPRTANSILAKQMDQMLEDTSSLFLASLHLFQSTAHDTTPGQLRHIRDEILRLRHSLSGQAGALASSYHDARYEITYSYVPIKDYEPLVARMRDMQSLLASRTGLDISSIDIVAANGDETANLRVSHVDVSVRSLVDQVAQANLAGIAFSRQAINKASGHDRHYKHVHTLSRSVLGSLASTSRLAKMHVSQTLQITSDRMKASIVASLDAVVHQRTPMKGQPDLLKDNTLKDCYFLTSLVEFTDIVTNLLDLASSLPDPALGAQKRMRLHRIMAAMSQLNHPLDAEGTESTDDLHAPPVGANCERQHWLKKDGHRQRVSQKIRGRLHIHSHGPFHEHALSTSLLGTLRHRLSRLSTFAKGASALKYRLWLSRELHRILRSPHPRYGLKAALGVSLLCLPGHLPEDNPGRLWFVRNKGYWISIAYIYVLQTITGATIRTAFYRMMGTLAGALYGFVGQKIAGDNPQALVAVIMISSAATDYLVLRRPRFAYFGIVWSMTLPSVLFVPFLGIEHKSMLDVALNRAMNISLGILAALIVCNLFWPYHARYKLVSTTAKAVDHIATLFLSISKHAHAQAVQKQPTLVDATMEKKFDNLEASIKAALARARTLCSMLRLEISLSPKPSAEYAQMLDALEDVCDLMSGLRTIRTHIPRRTTALDLLPERAELVSTVLLTLHAVSHSLHTHAPVPQFLPKPALAFHKLVLAIEDHIQRANASTEAYIPRCEYFMRNETASSSMTLLAAPVQEGESGFSPAFHLEDEVDRPLKHPEAHNKLGFSFAFALAEQEALSKIVDSLEDVLLICRDLYGEATFIQADDALPIDLQNHLATLSRSRRNSVVSANGHRI